MSSSTSLAATTNRPWHYYATVFAIDRKGNKRKLTPEEVRTVMGVDIINHPEHYNQHPSGIECIEVVQHFEFNIGNAIKYLWRAGLKEGTGYKTDLEKAKKYIEFELKRFEEYDLGVE